MVTTTDTDFCRVNADLDPAVVADVRDLPPGESLLAGGGAAPLVRITRLRDGRLSIDDEPERITDAQLHTIALSRALRHACADGLIEPGALARWAEEIRPYAPQLKAQRSAAPVHIEHLMQGFRMWMRRRRGDSELQTTAGALYWPDGPRSPRS